MKHTFGIPERRPDTLGIYVHVPWCIQKCDYCDFYSVGLNPGREHRADESPPSDDELQLSIPEDALAAYLEAVETELRARRNEFEQTEVDSIFFGGGTATLLPAEAIDRLLRLFRDNFAVSERAEVTVEGNPENITRRYLKQLAKLGVNRINVGLQTKNKQLLSDMNRYFNPKRYYQVLKVLKESEIPNIGADLIYGFAGQTANKFHSDLKPLLDKELPHVSLYALTVEAGTPYANAVKNQTAPPPNEKLQAELFIRSAGYMKRLGYHHYEISNFARPGAECRHNLRYWLYEPYLGLGPGAHGFNGKKRYGNPRNLEKWLSNPAGAALKEGNHITDFVLGYLRLCHGISPALMARTLQGCGYDKMSTSLLDEILDYWQEEMLIDADEDGSFSWSPIGLAYHNDRILEMIAFLEERL